MLKKIKFPLFLKFALLMLLLTVGPLAIVGIRTVNINRDALQDAILELYTHLAKSFAEKIDTYLKEIYNELPYITSTLSEETLPWPSRETILRTVVDAHENIVSISLIDTTGREKIKIFNPSLLEKEPKLLDFKSDEAFKLYSEKKQNQIMSNLYFYESKDPRLNLFHRLNERFSLLIVLSLKTLWAQLNEIHIGKTGYAFLVNQKGKIIAHPDKEKFGTSSTTNLDIVNQAIKAVSEGSSEYPDEKGEMIVGSYAPVKGLGWAVIVQQPKKEAYYSSIIMQRQAIYLIIASIILVACFSFYLARHLTRPVLALIKAAGRIVQRDFSVKVNLKTRDELNDLITTFNDMTSELKKYEDIQIDKLIAEKTKTEAVIFSIGEGIIMTNYQGELLLINHQARNVLGVSEEKLEGKYLWDYLSDQKLTDALREIIHGPTEATKIKEIEISQHSRIGFYKTSTQPVVTPKGEKLGLVTVLRDITLEKEIDRMKEDFLHSITHDLRNPMTSIRGFLKFLLDGIGGPLTDKQHKMVETMDRASTRLLGMINDILDLAKLESGRIELQLSDTDFSSVTQKVVDLLQPQIAKKNITVKINKINEIPVISVDQRLLERVINNLVANALKFTPQDGVITVTLDNKPENIEISIADTGEGIPPNYIDKIFDKFQQVTGQRKGGTGLGLTICKYVVEAHKGKIWVESKVGQGAKFSFLVSKNLVRKSNGEIVCEIKEKQAVSVGDAHLGTG